MDAANDCGTDSFSCVDPEAWCVEEDDDSAGGCGASTSMPPCLKWFDDAPGTKHTYLVSLFLSSPYPAESSLTILFNPLSAVWRVQEWRSCTEQRCFL